MRRILRSWIIGCCALGLLLAVAVAASAREVEITLANGRTVSGEFVSQASDSVTIRIADIETTYPRSQIRSMEVKRSLQAEYEQRKAELEADDHVGQYKLARWLYNRGTAAGYRLALKELNGLLESKPDHTQARLLRDVVRDKLEQEEAENRSAGQMRKDSEGEAAAADDPEPGIELLSEAQIRLIKVFEVSLGDRPRVQLPQELITRLYREYGNDPVMQPYRGRQGMGRFRRLRGFEQLGILFDLKARELYDEVRVRDEPGVLNTFRTRIHTNYVVRYCGRCHGRGRSKGLYVVTRGASSEKVAYTNYMLLRQTVAEQKPLIYRPMPAESPLLQYGLPRRDAETPHPAVTGYRPYFQSAEDPRYRQMVNWVGRLWGETEDYPIEFRPPKGFRGGTEPGGGGPQAGSDRADLQSGGS